MLYKKLYSRIVVLVSYWKTYDCTSDCCDMDDQLKHSLVKTIRDEIDSNVMDCKMEKIKEAIENWKEAVDDGKLFIPCDFCIGTLLHKLEEALENWKTEHKEEQYLELTKAVDFWMREVLAKNAHPCSMDKNCGKKLVDLLYEKFEYMPIVGYIPEEKDFLISSWFETSLSELTTDTESSIEKKEDDGLICSKRARREEILPFY